MRVERAISETVALVLIDDSPSVRDALLHVQVWGDTGAHFSTHVESDPLTIGEARDMRDALDTWLRVNERTDT